jgi:hypothetical protein
MAGGSAGAGTMIQVDQAIRRVNRSVALTWAIHALLALAVGGGLIVGSILQVPSILLASIPCILWVLLAVNGYRETHNAMRWPMLIASGDLEQAEQEIENAIHGFSVMRSVKLLSLHHLSVLRMAQRNWADAARLSKAMQGHHLSKDGSLKRASLLVLAASAARVGQMHDAYSALQRLRRMPLTLDEQLSLLHAESVYLGRLGAWDALAWRIDVKVRMAELMPTEYAVQTQAFLALAARRTGQSQWTGYLSRRCELLCDVAVLAGEEPVLAELWQHNPTGSGGV